MNRKLFVYGTLMLEIQSPIANFLRKNANFLGEGRLSGRLFDLGEYPGAVFLPNLEETVKGHIFELYDAAQSFEILDEYEGISPQMEYINEYKRMEVPIATDAGKMECWVYLYQLDTGGLQVISSGDYGRFIKNSERHQNFVKNQF